ncbi:MAG: NAD(P)H-hydrate dehydratase [Alphaproteobacteria bacterium]|nr:NAD(P)H-hydrate dehydratase [Alphaproteobacteria bacterium]
MTAPSSFELLSVEEMYRADRAAMEAGVSGPTLMAAAGWAVAAAVRKRWKRQRIAVLCGPGNNGGDGFVAARLLARAGWPVRVALLGNREALRGDAGWAAARWHGPVVPLSPDVFDGCAVAIDALFGAGLTRPLEGVARDVVATMASRRISSCAVDVPSGLHGDTGEPLGGLAHAAQMTVTFFRRKPAHFLLPGRALCGEVVVADIGIPESVLADIAPMTFTNAPGLWSLPPLPIDSHKYTRGHAVVVGGNMTGAARLAARAARRVGAGLVTLAVPPEAVSLCAADMPGNIVLTAPDATALRVILADRRKNVLLVGPGSGVGEATRERTLAALVSGRSCVLDADALTSFRNDPETLLDAITCPCVLTPHDGEYAAIFGTGTAGSRLLRARIAAQRSRAVVVLKGADTVIAAPDGRAAINANAPPDLATAGSGDVLAGLITGLLAQGADPFHAACAAVWLHGEAARRVGPGLIAEDLPEALGPVLAAVRDRMSPAQRSL